VQRALLTSVRLFHLLARRNQRAAATARVRELAGCSAQASALPQHVRTGVSQARLHGAQSRRLPRASAATHARPPAAISIERRRMCAGRRSAHRLVGRVAGAVRRPRGLHVPHSAHRDPPPERLIHSRLVRGKSRQTPQACDKLACTAVVIDESLTRLLLSWFDDCPTLSPFFTNAGAHANPDRDSLELGLRAWTNVSPLSGRHLERLLTCLSCKAMQHYLALWQGHRSRRRHQCGYFQLALSMSPLSSFSAPT
jgi:hypothetical protein